MGPLEGLLFCGAVGGQFGEVCLFSVITSFS